jgi:hypothetical protein
MSSVAEIEAAIEQLSPGEVSQLAAWLESRRQQMLKVAVETTSTGTFSNSRGGVPLLPFKGEVITPEKIYRLMEFEGV